MTGYLEISTRDPIIARDGRPFGATQGLRMKSLDWLYPSVTAGMVRTLLGEKNGGGFSSEAIKALKRMEIAGALPMSASQLFFPAPQDLAVEERNGEEGKRRIAWAGRPHKLQAGEGTDLPSYLSPVMLPRSASDFKPAKAPWFWSAAKMTEWLLNASGAAFEPPPDPEDYSPANLLSLGYLKIQKDERFHVAIESGTYAARDAHLFMTVALAIPEDVKISVRVKTDPAFDIHLNGLNQWAALGGERRFVHVSASEHRDLWACPAPVREALGKTNLVRMALATPALFKGGWKPGWIGDDGQGEFAGLRLQLVGACVERWKPVSGWSYEAPRGPKPALRLAPSGSVYFFQVEGNASSLADQWLQPVSDFSEDGQSGRDGFGLALWAPWAPHPE